MVVVALHGGRRFVGFATVGDYCRKSVPGTSNKQQFKLSRRRKNADQVAAFLRDMLTWEEKFFFAVWLLFYHLANCNSRFSVPAKMVWSWNINSNWRILPFHVWFVCSNFEHIVTSRSGKTLLYDTTCFEKSWLYIIQLLFMKTTSAVQKVWRHMKRSMTGSQFRQVQYEIQVSCSMTEV